MESLQATAMSRDDRTKAEHSNTATKRKRSEQGRSNEEIKLAFRLATWHGRLAPNLTLNEYIALYVNTPIVHGGKLWRRK